MNKKIFTILLLAVFVLAQFSAVTAAPAAVVPGTVSAVVTTAPTYAYPATTINLEYSVSYNAATSTTSLFLLVTKAAAVFNTANTATTACVKIKALPAATVASTITGKYTFDYADVTRAPGLLAMTTPVATDVFTFRFAADTAVDCAAGPTVLANPGAAPFLAVSTTYIAPIVGTPSFTAALPVFSKLTTTSVKLLYSVTGMASAANQNLKIWSRVKASPATAWPAANCYLVGTLAGSTSAGEYIFDMTGKGYADQDVVEFIATLDSGNACVNSVVPATSATSMASTFIDNTAPTSILASPPSLDVAGTLADNAMACNTFEFWGMTTDMVGFDPDLGYSGTKSMNAATTGTFAVPAPISDVPTMFSWSTAFPATASGTWTYGVTPTDNAGNAAAAFSFRTGAPAVSVAEKAACPSFTDAVGNANEVQIRYLAKLGLVAGMTTTTFAPAGTLTRAEAATLFVRANGGSPATNLTAPSTAACTFTDVKTADWFSGWVWQACKDGFMAGTATPGIFDPNNTFTRGQSVTVFEAINKAPKTGYFAANSATYKTILNTNAHWQSSLYRSVAWTDILLGDFFATAAQHAYNAGVIEGTGATTFGGNTVITRGEFARMLYRSLSRLP